MLINTSSWKKMDCRFGGQCVTEENNNGSKENWWWKNKFHDHQLVGLVLCLTIYVECQKHVLVVGNRQISATSTVLVYEQFIQLSKQPHIIKNVFNNVPLHLPRLWMKINHLHPFRKIWGKRVDQLHPLPPFCMSSWSPGFSRCPRGYRLWSLFQKQLKSMAAQLVASVGSVEVFRFSPFCFLGKQVTSRNKNHFIFIYENHRCFWYVCICILVFWRYNVSHYL